MTRGHGLGGRSRQRPSVVAAYDVLLAIGDGGGHAGLLVGLAVLDLDHPDAVQALHDRRRQGRGGGHGPARRLGRPTHEAAKAERDEGRRQQDDQAQAPVGPGHHRQGGDEGQALLDEVEHAAGRRLADQARVIEHRRDVAAGMGFAEPGEIGPHQLAEKLVLDIADDAVADAVDEQGLDGLGEAAADGQGDDGKRQDEERASLWPHHQVVHRRLQDAEQQAREGGEDDGAGDRGGQGLPARREVVAGDARGDASRGRRGPCHRIGG